MGTTEVGERQTLVVAFVDIRSGVFGSLLVIVAFSRVKVAVDKQFSLLGRQSGMSE